MMETVTPKQSTPLPRQAGRELLDVCKTKDPELACAALCKHITDARRILAGIHQRHREQHLNSRACCGLFLPVTAGCVLGGIQPLEAFNKGSARCQLEVTLQGEPPEGR